MRDESETLRKEINSLIPKIARGESKALDRLFVLTGAKLTTMARRYLSDKNSAEDVVSEVYLKVVKSASSFDKKQNGLNWLYKITKNTALNMNRVYQRENAALDEVEDIASVFSPLCGDNLEISALTAALEKLDPEDRRILYLRYWEGLTVRETAKAIGKPATTTQDKLKKLLKRLREMLE